MKKGWMIIAATVVFLLGAEIVSATAPQSLQISYDGPQRVLTIRISHLTRDLTEHFIRRIVIFKNDVELQNIPLTKQASSDEIIQKLTIDLVAGDVISVKAICSKAGYKQESMTIAGESEPTQTDLP